jgi:CheY-like chemotaxis protein
VLQAELQKLVIETANGAAEVHAEIETLAFDGSVLSLQTVELAPGCASQPEKNDGAASNEKYEAEEAHFYQRPFSGDTPEATGGMICSNHRNPNINILAKTLTKQTKMRVLQAVGTNPAKDGSAELDPCPHGGGASKQTDMSKRVLVADDDPSIRESLKKILEESGYEVLLAEDGDVAEQLLKREKVDLLLLDLEMPKRDGWDVFEGVRSRCSDLPIIMITGLATQLETRLIPGLDALLEKPIEVPILLEKVEELLCESPTQRQARLDARDATGRAISTTAPGYLSFLTHERTQSR